MAKKKKQTIGYKYFASGHFVLCHGPIDAITEISFQDKDAYLNEENANKTIYINKPSLFGGDEQSGGVQGNIELLFGHADQQKSSVLQRICAKISNAFGGLISAYRGVCSVVFNNVYIGTAPNMPDSKWRVKRIHTRHDGQVQWYDEKAEITPFREAIREPVATDVPWSDRGIDYFVIGAAQEISGSYQHLNTYFDGHIDSIRITKGVSRYNTERYSPSQFTQSGDAHWSNVVSLCDFSEGSAVCKKRNTVTLHDGAVVDMESRKFGTTSLKLNGTTSYAKLITGEVEQNLGRSYTVEAWLKLKTRNNINFGACFLSCGPLSTAAQDSFFTINGDKMRHVQHEYVGLPAAVIDSNLEAVPDNEWVCLSFSHNGATGKEYLHLNGALITGRTVSAADINPSHIIRECLTNRVWGIGVAESNIDDASFKIAADILYDEQMGMSIKWTDSTSINEFVDNIKEHINAQLYLDRVTNKWKLYLIRDDYDVADLLSLNESNIRNLDFERRTLAECVNSVTVTYWDRERAKDSTVTVQDIARIAQQGGVISQAVDYKGFTNSDLASRIALRDLKTLSSTLASVSFDVDESFSESWHEGMPFKLSDESYGLSEAVMRIRTIKRGDGINNTVYVEAIEDSFSSPMQSVIEYVPPITSGDSTAKDAVAIAFEVPYIELVEQYGQDEVDAKLSNYPELGYVGMAAIRPNNQHVNASLYVDAGAGYDERTTLDFCPSAELKAEIGYMDSSFEIQNVAEFELLQANNRIQINDEIMAFVSFDDVTSVITVKRGCFDTVPQKHVSGSKIFVWDNYSGIDDIEYLGGEVLSLKALTLTGSDVLELNVATAHNLSLSSRAIRPYPPANVKINDMYWPAEIETDLVLTWVDRNRLQQTGGGILGWFDGGVAIEPGTQTHLTITQFDEDQVEIATNNANVTGSTSYTLAISAIQANTRTVEVVLKTIRDGYECLNPFTHTVELSQFFSAPYDLTVEFKND